MSLFGIDSLILMGAPDARRTKASTSDPRSAPLSLAGDPKEFIARRLKDYYRAAVFYRGVYYTTRISVGLCAGILPFAVASYQLLATILSICVVVFTVLDSVLRPQEKWKTFSRATDLMYVAALRHEGKYEGIKEMIDVIFDTEQKQIAELVTIEATIKAAQAAHTAPAAPLPPPAT